MPENINYSQKSKYENAHDCYPNAALGTTGLEIEMERRHKRAPLSADVRLLIDRGAHTSVLRGMMVEISLSGIGVYLTQPLEVGSKVELELSYLVSSDETKTEALRGTTIYSKHIHNIYFVGIEFAQELDPYLQPKLYSRIQKILKSY